MLTKKLLLISMFTFAVTAHVQADQIAPQAPNAIDPDSAIAFLMGKAGVEDKFATIASRYASRAGLKLDPKAYEAFKQMHAAAQKDGVKLVIKSATRNFAYQRGIWEGKWTGARKVDGQNLSRSIPDPATRALKILENSSMPGSSRHHWGTDIDLNSFNNSYFRSGKGKKEYDWLVANAGTFGFCQPYTAKGAGRNTGYNEERWHWTYMPVSQRYTQDAGMYLNDALFSGFQGAETAPQIKIVENYVLGINSGCR